MRLSIEHSTRYEFSQAAIHGLQRFRLTPKNTHGQEIVAWDMALEGANFEVEYDDHHFNRTTLVSLKSGARVVSVTCSGVIDTADKAGIIGQHSGHMPLWTFLRPTALTRAGLKIRALVAHVDADRGNKLDFLHALSEAVRGAVEYQTGATDVNTTAEQALAGAQGVCQDQAHVFISAGRLIDVPMRYVSGYLMMNDRIEQDAGHGWVEAHLEGLGWVGFDVSNGISPDERYVRVATGRDYREAAPVTGMAVGAGTVELRVELSVEQQQSGQQQQQLTKDQFQQQ
ncbi:MAG: transglutaminase family protein [Burkholderiales bacterium]|nr:MAG: transglutaminase family protein [Burkholderiales bacterium]